MSPLVLSVIIPTLDEADAVARAVVSAGAADEVIVVDGGSSDATKARALAAGAMVLDSRRGRGRQMNAGVAKAGGDLLLFLHADTVLPAGFRGPLTESMAGGARWGRFDVELDGPGLFLAAIGGLINRRSRFSRVATGDQAIFVERRLFESVGGYSEEPLFEDIDLCRKLKRRSVMARPGGCRVLTSARRWMKAGTVRVSLQMWALKLLYLGGVPPAWLKRFYPDQR